MSSFLYRLGQSTVRHARSVLAAWLVLLVVVGAAAGLAGGSLRDDLSIPGTEAQEGLDVLDTRFPEVAGTSAQVVYRVPEGSRIGDHRAAVRSRVEALEGLERVVVATDPFAPESRDLAVSEDLRHALVQVQLDRPLEQIDDEMVAEIERVSSALPDGSEVEVLLGGQMFTSTGVPVSVTEALGLAVALVVLVMTLGSLVAAGIPLLTAVVGVGVSMAGLLVVASFATINSSTPSLAMMIGLAVGIDYALFLAARHRDQLADGMEVAESGARAVATAGSAVIFAGATVVIALCGLVVARIPFLSVMGVAAAAAVTVAVVVAVTLVPAVLALAGERLRPRRPARRTPEGAVSGRWVGLATRRPALTLGVGVAALVVLALPAKDLTLGLPDNGSAPHGATERLTYDVIEDAYGPGFNSPLLVTADIIRTTEPVRVMERIGEDLAGVRGVEAVALTTPNRTADLGIVQIIPAHGQTDPRTADLVREIRSQAPQIEERYDVTELRVTGQTAVTIDVSERLGGALLPFGGVVVGLSLLLLTVVFRSVAVPVKATLGYLLSVAASFGAVVAVFQWGWFADLLNVERPGPVLSFLPIVLMGVLFGLAMDYEVFLVTRMREHWVHTGDARGAVSQGFTASSRVVVAAAVIMVAVFASFVPHGDSSVKPIAFGLAVGVLVDAFAVRMTLVPAVLALLGDRAWRLPAWLDRRLPSLDVEGEGLGAHLEHEAWTQQHGPAAVRLEGVGLVDPATGLPVLQDVDLVVPNDGGVVVTGEPVARQALLSLVAGRLRPDRGTAVVLDHLLPAESAWVRARIAVERTRDAGARARGPLLLLDVDAAGALPAGPLGAATGAVLVACPREVAGDLAARLGALLVDLDPDPDYARLEEQMT